MAATVHHGKAGPGGGRPRTVQCRQMFAEIVQAVRVWADSAGGLGVFVVAVLDSSVMALPNATDALVMYLTIQHPAWWWYYAAMGAAGVVVGSWPLYLVARRGGQAFLGRRLSGPRASGAVAWYKRSAFAAIAGPAFVPPPMPLKIFVLLAGATAYAPWRLVTALVLGRGSRHAIEAGLAAAYRDEAVRAFERYGPTLAVGVLAVVTALAVGLYVWHARRTAA
jgi:membrane protein YqaA with SNARE-associated domain